MSWTVRRTILRGRRWQVGETVAPGDMPQDDIDMLVDLGALAPAAARATSSAAANDDLTDLKGVGRATARALAQAGYGSFAALAAADADALMAHEALGGLRAGPAEVAGWIAEAGERMKDAARKAGSEAGSAGQGSAPAEPAE